MFCGSLTGHYWTMTHSPAGPAFEQTMITSTSIFLALKAIGLALALIEPKVTSTH